MYEMLAKAVVMLLVAAISQGTSDPCATTRYIDNWKRSIAYTTKPGEAKICDSFLPEDWYRVISGAGELMPTKCVDDGFRCGTDQPIWLSRDGLTDKGEIYPVGSEPVERTAYAVYYKNCTFRSYRIKIKKCDSYYVYRLKTVFRCNSGYCFGSELPCEKGSTSETGFTPGCQKYPNVTVTPKITTGYAEKRELKNGYTKVTRTPKFFCLADDATQGYRYDIFFYINNVKIHNATYRNVTLNKMTSAVLLQEHWEKKFKPNMEVKCSIQVRQNGFGSPGLQTFSSSYFAGIKVLRIENGFRVKEGHELNISVELTLPLACSYYVNAFMGNQMSDCFIALFNTIPDYQNGCTETVKTGGIVFRVKRCSLEIPYETWDQIHNMTVIGKSDDTINTGNRYTVLRIYSYPNASSVLDVIRNVWDNFVLPDIQIIIEDTDFNMNTKDCRSESDPYITTFDSRSSWSFQDDDNDPRAGEYVMYQHSRLPLQVNAYVSHCDDSSMALCNCGVAVRSSESLFVANFCETRFEGEKVLNWYVAERMCSPHHLVVETENTTYPTTYTITLPTGTVVKFKHSKLRSTYYGISYIHITPTQFDFMLTKGLCGNYSDIDGPDDYVTPSGSFDISRKDKWNFAKSWRVDDSESLFNPSTKLPTVTYTPQKFCSCAFPANDTGPNGPPIFNCSQNDEILPCGNFQHLVSNFGGKCPETEYRVKRSASLYDKDEQPTIYPNIRYKEDRLIPREPVAWRNNLTEDIARDMCQSAFEKTSSYELCTSYVGSVDPVIFIEECVRDMKALGDDSFLQITLDIFSSKCLTNAKRMENLTQTNTVTKSGITKSIIEQISEFSCPEDCSGKGTCLKGVCICNPDFYGEDCSFEKNEAPLLSKYACDKSCDTSTKPCKKFRISGINFFNADDLTCKFRSFVITSGNTLVYNNDTLYSRGRSPNSFSMFCPLPETMEELSFPTETVATGYLISVSNDGRNFTDEITILAFDFSCYECNTTTFFCKMLETHTRKEAGSTRTQNYVIGISVGVAVTAVLTVSATVLLLRRKSLKKKCYRFNSTNQPKQKFPIYVNTAIFTIKSFTKTPEKL